MRTVFVSGGFDILHAGHIQFLEDARNCGARLVVCCPTDRAMEFHKGKKPSLPFEHRQRLLAALRMVDEVVPGDDCEVRGFNFITQLSRLHGDAVLATTEDDVLIAEKSAYCEKHGVPLIVLPKRFDGKADSTSAIIRRLRTPEKVPLRLDFAGGWLDVPEIGYKYPGYIVNLSVTPMVSLSDWPYRICSGLGSSAAHSLLQGDNPVDAELGKGVGWQDPAVIMETGLCAWRTGHKPVLAIKQNPDFLMDRLWLWDTGIQRNCMAEDFTGRKRNYDRIQTAGLMAEGGVACRGVDVLMSAVQMSYLAQLDEGMAPLPQWFPKGFAACKYCGAGWGGYAMYLFRDPVNTMTGKGWKQVQPYMRCL